MGSHLFAYTVLCCRPFSVDSADADEQQGALTTNIIPVNNVFVIDRFTEEDIKDLLLKWLAYEKTNQASRPNTAGSSHCLGRRLMEDGCTIDELATNIHDITAGHKGLTGLICDFLTSGNANVFCSSVNVEDIRKWHQFVEASLQLCTYFRADAGTWYYRTSLQNLFGESERQVAAAVLLYGQHYEELRVPLQTMLWHGCIQLPEGQIAEYHSLLERGGVMMHPAPGRTDADVLFTPNPDRLVNLTTPSPLFTATALQKLEMSIIKEDPPASHHSKHLTWNGLSHR